MPQTPRILLVEDDPLMRDLIRLRLGTAGYEVHAAHTGREAIERIVMLRPQAMLLDINLPDFDGFAVLEALKADMPDLKVPTIMLTSRTSPEDVRRAVALGARDYLSKQGLDGQLLPRLRRLLRTAHLPGPGPLRPEVRPEAEDEAPPEIRGDAA